MGLREVKAARSRQRMIEVALELFSDQGYDETTMEQIAERAEVGTTTLYRYFPTKDQLLLDPLIDVIDPAPHLRARPPGEPLDVAMGEALIATAAAFDGRDARLAEMRRLVDGAAVVRAKLWDRYRMIREGLEAVIAERTAQEAGALEVRVAAGLMLDVFQMIDRPADDHRSHAAILADVLRRLPTLDLWVPRLPVSDAMAGANGD